MRKCNNEFGINMKLFVLNCDTFFLLSIRLTLNKFESRLDDEMIHFMYKKVPAVNGMKP